ncbi:MAG: hypothetical protein M0P70_13655 [Desulfobulbaceae bacterium]|jgi:hypothetical protein|nr:hypothetical protein [Desulfobulbaceae bacterium]
MTPAEIIQAALGDGVKVTLSSTGTIKATGEQPGVNRWCPFLRENKGELIRYLASGVNHQTLAVPKPCQNCLSLELQDIAGVTVPGCVMALPGSSPWREEWRMIPSGLMTCKRKQTTYLDPMMAKCFTEGEKF